jgi:hypothetical protein
MYPLTRGLPTKPLVEKNKPEELGGEAVQVGPRAN